MSASEPLFHRLVICGAVGAAAGGIVGRIVEGAVCGVGTAVAIVGLTGVGKGVIPGTANGVGTGAP